MYFPGFMGGYPAHNKTTNNRKGRHHYQKVKVPVRATRDLYMNVYEYLPVLISDQWNRTYVRKKKELVRQVLRWKKGDIIRFETRSIKHSKLNLN